MRNQSPHIEIATPGNMRDSCIHHKDPNTRASLAEQIETYKGGVAFLDCYRSPRSLLEGRRESSDEGGEERARYSKLNLITVSRDNALPSGVILS